MNLLFQSGTPMAWNTAFLPASILRKENGFEQLFSADELIFLKEMYNKNIAFL